MAPTFLRRCKHLAAPPPPEVLLAWPLWFAVQERDSAGRSADPAETFISASPLQLRGTDPFLRRNLCFSMRCKQESCYGSTLLKSLLCGHGWSSPRGCGHCPKPARIQEALTWGSAVQGVGPDRPCRFLPAADILWFHSFLLLQSSCSVFFCSFS